MKYMEIIYLRSASEHYPKVELCLKDIDRSIDNEINPISIEIYRNFNVDTDWSILLKNEKKEANIQKSSLGLHLAALFKEFGLIHHSIWIIKENKAVL